MYDVRAYTLYQNAFIKYLIKSHLIKDIGLKHHTYFYSVVMEFSSCDIPLSLVPCFGYLLKPPSLVLGSFVSAGNIVASNAKISMKKHSICESRSEAQVKRRSHKLAKSTI